MGISPYAILSGLLQGAGGAATGIGNAITEGEKQRAERDRLAIEQQRADAAIAHQQATIAESQAGRTQNQSQFNATQKAADDARFTDLPASMGGGRTARELLPFLFAKAGEDAKRQDEAAKLATMRGAILNQPAQADMAMPAGGAMYSEAETLPGKAATPKNAVLAAILGEQGAAAILEQMYPKGADKITHAPAGSGILGPNGEIIGMVPNAPREPKEQGTTSREVQTAQGAVIVTVDAQGREVGRVRVGDLPPHAPREAPQPTASVTIDNLMREYQAIKRQNPSDPRLAELDQRIQGQRFTMVPPGGAPWSVASQTQGPQNPPQATGGERSDLADMRTSLKTLDTLIGDVEANRGVLGNLASNTGGSIRRGLSEYIPSMTTPAEKKFLASLSFQVAEIKRAFIGAAQTDPELKGLLDLLPDKGQADINVLPRLQAIRDYTSRKYGERQAPFQQPGAGAAKRIRLDAQGNPTQ